MSRELMLLSIAKKLYGQYDNLFDNLNPIDCVIKLKDIENKIEIFKNTYEKKNLLNQGIYDITRLYDIDNLYTKYKKGHVSNKFFESIQNILAKLNIYFTFYFNEKCLFFCSSCHTELNYQNIINNSIICNCIDKKLNNIVPI